MCYLDAREWLPVEPKSDSMEIKERDAYLEERCRDVCSGQQRTESSTHNAKLFQVPVCTNIKINSRWFTLILPLWCPRVCESALERTAGCCVRHIRSQGEPPGPPKATRSQKIKRCPVPFWEDMIYWTTCSLLVLPFLVCIVQLKGIITRVVQRSGTMPMSLHWATDKRP